MRDPAGSRNDCRLRGVRRCRAATLAASAGVLAVIALAAGPAAAGDRALSGKAGFSSMKEFDAWNTFYYLSPDPERVPAALRFLDERGLLEKRSSRLPEAAFLSAIFRANERMLPRLCGGTSGLGAATKRVVWRALRLSGTETGREILKRELKSATGADADFIERLLRRRPPDLMAAPVTSPADLDMLWGAFFATGNTAFVKRVIDAACRPGAEGGMDAALTKAAAQWSLAANARRHRRVMRLCREEAAGRSGAGKECLGKIIRSASSSGGIH